MRLGQEIDDRPLTPEQHPRRSERKAEIDGGFSPRPAVGQVPEGADRVLEPARGFLVCGPRGGVRASPMGVRQSPVPGFTSEGVVREAVHLSVAGLGIRIQALERVHDGRVQPPAPVVE